MKSITLLLFILVIVFPQKAFASSVVINEIMAKPDDEIEWVELFNSTTETINLSGWKIKDGNSSANDDLSLSGQITAGGFLVFEHSKGWLNDSGTEVVSLLDGDSAVDSYQYEGAAQGKTSARVPDAGTWISNSMPTKSSTNGSPTPSPSPSPTPTPSSTPLPTPTPTPIPTSTPTSTPTPTPSPTSTQASFIISDFPSQINSDQVFTIKIALVTPNNPNTDYYLKGAFKKVGGSRYFGLTKISSDWVEYGDENTDHYKITTDGSGKWSGSLEIKPDLNDKDYKGQGDYVFKIGRLTSSTSNPTWSNEKEIKINVLSNTENITNNEPIPTEQTQISDQESESESVVIQSRLALNLHSSSETASVAGEATHDNSSNAPKLKPEYLAISGTGLVIISGVLGWFLKQKLIKI